MTVARVGGAERPLDAIYDDLWNVREIERWAEKETSLQPRPPSHLFELVSGIGLGPATRVLDAGCGQGDHACELALRFGSPVTALDPVESNLETARRRIRESGLAQHVVVQRGLIEQLPFTDASFALVWCRSVVLHLRLLVPAFAECWRVLAPGGSMLLQTGFATDSLEAREAAVLRRRLGFVAASMRRATVEEAFAEVGFTVGRSEAYGSEFAECYEARDGRCGRDLAGIARLQRAEAPLVQRFGRQAYETALGMYSWQVFQMLGKISYHAYLLSKAS